MRIGTKRLLAAVIASLALAGLAGAAAAAGYADGDDRIGPDYTPAPELAGLMEPLRGTVRGFTMAPDKFYPGIHRLTGYKPLSGPNSDLATAPFDQASAPEPYYPRHVEVYTPPGYKPGQTLPFMVVLDGVWVTHVHDPVLQAVDGMIATKQLPPMALILIDPGSHPVDPAALSKGPDGAAEDAPGSERSLEYDTVSSRFGDFIQEEVLPAVEQKLNIKLTDDPEGRAVYGISSSGVAAFSMAWFHPERYRRVMIYSGTFINNQNPVDPALPHGAWEYHEHLIPGAPKKPIRVWLEVGDKDNGYTSPESSHRNWVIANTHMAAALKAKGYAYRFVLAKDAQHVDDRVVRQTLPQALTYIWQGYSPR
jgi:enterochelin esterase family protein